MSAILKELNQLKGYYTGEFKFDIIPRYFPPTKFPEMPYLIKSWQEKQGYTDVFIRGKMDGFPGKRKISDLFLCYKPFLEEIAPETEEKLKKIEQETGLSIETASHYIHFGKSGPGVFVQREGKIPINTLIEFLEKIEWALIENVSIIFSRLKKKEE